MYKILDDRLFDQILAQADESPRKRSHFNLHGDLSDPIQRLCIGLVKGTYVRPHHHPEGNRWELILALRGTVAIVFFDKAGTVTERLLLDSTGAVSGVELEPGSWHSVYPVTEEALIMEVKEGPYLAFRTSDIAPWAPAEGDAEVGPFLHWLEDARPGDHWQQSLPD